MKMIFFFFFFWNFSYKQKIFIYKTTICYISYKQNPNFDNEKSKNKIIHGNHGGKYRDISAIYRVSGGVDTIFHGEKSERRYFRKYRRYIGDGRYIGDFFKKSPLVAKNRWYIGDISLIFWWYFPSFMQCDLNGNMTIQQPDCSQFFIQRLKLIFNGKLMFQRLFWPKFLL